MFERGDTGLPQGYEELKITRRKGESSEAASDLVARESPLEIVVNGEVLTTLLRTPGDDSDLILGFLYSSGIIGGIEDIENQRSFAGEEGKKPFIYEGDFPSFLHSSASARRVEITLRSRSTLSLVSWNRFSWDSGMLSRAGRLAASRRKDPDAPIQALFDARLIIKLGDAMKENQTLFNLTGGTHAAAIFTKDGKIIKVFEDVGRHNAIDKAIGNALRARVDLYDKGLLLSGRASSEMVIKTAVSGIPLLCSVSAPTSLGVELAEKLGLTVVGFLREQRFNIYSHEWRIS